MSCQVNPLIDTHDDEMYREALMKEVDTVLDRLMRTALVETWEPAEVDSKRKRLAATVVSALRADARLLLGLESSTNTGTG